MIQIHDTVIISDPANSASDWKQTMLRFFLLPNGFGTSCCFFDLRKVKLKG